MCRSNLILKLEHPHFRVEVTKSDHVAAALQSPVGSMVVMVMALASVPVLVPRYINTETCSETMEAQQLTFQCLLILSGVPDLLRCSVELLDEHASC